MLFLVPTKCRFLPNPGQERKPWTVPAGVREPQVTIQGQRTLSPFRSKDLHQEVIAPTGDLAFSFDAIF